MVLESLFYGNFSPVEQVYPEDPEYRKALKSIEVLMQQLYKTLPPEDYQKVEEILSHYGAAESIEYLSFDIQHIGGSGGILPVNQSVIYSDRDGGTLVFPSPTVEVTCSSGGEIYPESSSEPTEILVPVCKDAVRTEMKPVHLLSLGRIVQMDVTLKAVCPGKRVAASIILMEIFADGTALPRGVKHILVPAQEGEICQDLTLHCIQFSLPEELDVTGGTDSICNSRSFSARVIANYVDTDFVCCDTESNIL